MWTDGYGYDYAKLCASEGDCTRQNLCSQIFITVLD